MTTKWKGNDISLSESVDEYGFVYKYDGNEFDVYCAIGYHVDGLPREFAHFFIDNKAIDDYFEDEGEEIVKMCGASQDDMDYEWKMDALLSYYGAYEFVNLYNEGVYTKDEIIVKVKNNWFGNIDC